MDQGQKTTYVDTLSSGIHLVRLTRDGFMDIDTAVTIRAGDPTRVILTLKPRS